MVTNSIDLATTVRAAQGGAEVVLLGGKLVSDVPGTFGELTLSEIRRFSADLAFVAPVALHPERGAFDFDLHEAEIAAAMIAQARRSVILVDHEKVGITSRVQYCPPEQLDTVVCDRAAPAAAIADLRRRGVRVII